MTEFDTLEKVNALFSGAGAQLSNNDFFIAYKDMQKNSGMAGGMEYPYDAMLINANESGLNLLYLNQDGIPFKLKMEKMHVKPDAFHFIGYDNIKNVTIKKYALLNNKTKKVIIKTKDGKTHYLVVNLSEPALAYHDAAFAAFLQKYAD